MAQGRSRQVQSTPQKFVFAALSSVAIGTIVLFWFYGGLKEDTSQVRNDTQRIESELGTFRSDTEASMAEIPETQEALAVA